MKSHIEQRAVTIAKYILETKQDVEKQASLRGILLNVFDEYSIFIIIYQKGLNIKSNLLFYL